MQGLTTDTSNAPAELAASLAQLDEIRERIRTCSGGFQDVVVSLCKEAGGHPDLDVRFLAIRIAFNGHYALKRSARKRDKEKEGK